MNTAIVENLIDDGLTSADNMSRVSADSEEETTASELPALNGLAYDGVSAEPPDSVDTGECH